VLAPRSLIVGERSAPWTAKAAEEEVGVGELLEADLATGELLDAAIDELGIDRRSGREPAFELVETFGHAERIRVRGVGEEAQAVRAALTRDGDEVDVAFPYGWLPNHDSSVRGQRRWLSRSGADFARACASAPTVQLHLAPDGGVAMG
jgi:hypothetical protein